MREPLSVERALERVLAAVTPLPPETVSLASCEGRILLDELVAEADLPAFDKALMDGLAVRASDLAGGVRELRVADTIAAGRDPSSLAALAPGSAARIMTGAPLPPGADAVVMVERTSAVAGDARSVRCLDVVAPGENVAPAGSDVRAGERLLAAGDWIGAAEIGVLAAFGRIQVRVRARPRVAVLATGDEIVPPGTTPGPGRIRNSNGPMLLALARDAGAETLDLGIAPDEKEALARQLGRGLESDLLIVSGGVSMGEYDLVGDVLRSLGVEVLFDAVAIKPGKPFTFGTRGRAVVAACPGNPVSGYVIFQVFIRAALRRMIGSATPAPPMLRGVLSGPLRTRAGRTGYHQARARFESGRCVVEIVPTSGSADLVSCARGNALAVTPAGAVSLAAGDPVDVLLLDHFDVR
ncbi:MAG TPA: gephyrin-like molybdotransferase Glp [Patescibacteria group bacterium]|nr:gephyrin-like molybdotransferase Glp [Patescibacteria group bacterium]